MKSILSSASAAASWRSRTRQYTGLTGMGLGWSVVLQLFAFGQVDDAVYLPAIKRMRKTRRPSPPRPQ